MAEAESRASRLEADFATLEARARQTTARSSLERSLRQSRVALIAEAKRESPSGGAIANGLDVAEQVRAYEQGGAAALSILTEPDHFGGSIEDLRCARAASTLPVLKKDFHIAPVQLLEARALGASAALVIVRAIPPVRLTDLVRVGAEIGLELLLEIRDEAELERALENGARMIGVNNRNLETLDIDAATAQRLIPRIPSSIVAIAESGIKSTADVERYARVGADAVLVGSSLSASSDPTAATRALTQVARVSRAG